MKILEREKTVVVTERVYVACDDEEFDTEKECLAHEDELQEAEDARCVESLKCFDYCAPTGDDQFHWAYVTDEDELQSFIRHWLNEEERSYWDYSDPSREVELREFPLWVVAIVDDEGFGAVHSAEDVLNMHKNFIEAVETSMKEKMEEDNARS